MKLACAFFSYTVISLLSLPAWASITLSNPTPMQGETIEVTYTHKVRTKDTESKADVLVFNEHTFKMFPVDSNKNSQTAENTENAEQAENKANPLLETYHCLIAVPADLTPGKYPVNIGTENSAVIVKDGVFPIQCLTLPKSKDNFLTSPGEEEAMDRAKAVLSDKRLWQGVFKKPCTAKTSAKFGLRRVVNGKLLKDYYHSGLDFAGSLGQPIYACANGKVILAHKNFRLHGNVVAIDHGQGVITIYIHMQKIAVKEGDIVSAGQQIGNVGATGRANGPHLHLSLYVNKIATNPMPWFTKVY